MVVITKWSSKKEILILFLILCFNQNFLSAQSSTFTRVDHPLVFVGHLNVDCIPDSIYSADISNGKFLPKYIVWGKLDSTACADSSNYSSYDSLKVPVTMINYPNWKFLSGSFMTTNFNQDSLTDIIFLISGYMDSCETNCDTSRMIAIFGQNGLDTMTNIYLNNIDTVQTLPFFACELIIGRGLSDPAIRDYSGYTSYDFNRILLNVIPEEEQNSGPVDQKDDLFAKGFVSIHPNPAIQILNLEIKNFPPGLYKLKLIALHGLILLEEEIDIRNESDLFRTINLQNYGNGYYSIILQKNGETASIIPFLIYH